MKRQLLLFFTNWKPFFSYSEETMSSILVRSVMATGDWYDFRARFESFLRGIRTADSLTANFLERNFRFFCLWISWIL